MIEYNFQRKQKHKEIFTVFTGSLGLPLCMGEEVVRAGSIGEALLWLAKKENLSYSHSLSHMLSCTFKRILRLFLATGKERMKAQETGVPLRSLICEKSKAVAIHRLDGHMT